MNGIEKIESSGALSGFLATTMPEIAGMDFAASLNPAQLVGGDFLGVHPVSDGLIIMIGDVAGKGPQAATVATLVQATLKSEIEHIQQPADLLRSINRLIYDDLDRSETFITVFLAYLHTKPLRLIYASAGHTTTFLWRSSQEEVLELSSTGLPLGIYPHLELPQQQLALFPGDVLVLYSNGVTEAEDAHGRVFGMQALVDILLAAHPTTVDLQLKMILSALDLHRGKLPLRDDVAIFLARVPPQDGHASTGTPFIYPAEISKVRALTRLVRRNTNTLTFASPSDCVKFCDELDLALSEIATNIVIHAYKDSPYMGRLLGRITIQTDRIRIDLIDSGVEYSPQTDPKWFSIFDPPTSGYGLVIAQDLLDVCQYRRLPLERNHWRLEKSTTPRS